MKFNNIKTCFSWILINSINKLISLAKYCVLIFWESIDDKDHSIIFFFPPIEKVNLCKNSSLHILAFSDPELIDFHVSFLQVFTRSPEILSDPFSCFSRFSNRTTIWNWYLAMTREGSRRRAVRNRCESRVSVIITPVIVIISIYPAD